MVVTISVHFLQNEVLLWLFEILMALLFWSCQISVQNVCQPNRISKAHLWFPMVFTGKQVEVQGHEPQEANNFTNLRIQKGLNQYVLNWDFDKGFQCNFPLAVLLNSLKMYRSLFYQAIGEYRHLLESVLLREVALKCSCRIIPF